MFLAVVGHHSGFDAQPDSRIIIQLWRHPGENPGGIQLQNPGNPGNPGQNLASPDPGLRENLASQAVVSNPGEEFNERANNLICHAWRMSSE